MRVNLCNIWVQSEHYHHLHLSWDSQDQGHTWTQPHWWSVEVRLRCRADGEVNFGWAGHREGSYSHWLPILRSDSLDKSVHDINLEFPHLGLLESLNFCKVEVHVPLLGRARWRPVQYQLGSHLIRCGCCHQDAGRNSVSIIVCCQVNWSLVGDLHPVVVILRCPDAIILIIRMPKNSLRSQHGDLHYKNIRTHFLKHYLYVFKPPPML